MPKRIPTDKSAKSVHTRPGGYSLEYFNPHSPFQRLVAGAIERKQLSYRQAAAAIGIAPSTLWVWLHNSTGFPAARTFRPEKHLPAIAKALGVPRDILEKSIDLSRLQFTAGVIPDPMPLLDAFADFIVILENTPGRTVNREKIIALARRLHAGASMEIEDPQPAPKAKVKATRARKPAT